MGHRAIVILSLLFVVGGLERPAWADGPSEVGEATDSPEAAAFEEAVRKVAPSAKPSKGKANGVLGSKRMRKANRVAAEMVKKRLRARGGNDLKLLAKAVSCLQVFGFLRQVLVQLVEFPGSIQTMGKEVLTTRAGTTGRQGGEITGRAGCFDSSWRVFPAAAQ